MCRGICVLLSLILRENSVKFIERNYVRQYFNEEQDTAVSAGAESGGGIVVIPVVRNFGGRPQSGALSGNGTFRGKGQAVPDFNSIDFVKPQICGFCGISREDKRAGASGAFSAGGILRKPSGRGAGAVKRPEKKGV